MLKRGTKHGAKWTPEDDDELRRRCEAGEILEDIGRALERSIEGVRTRTKTLKLSCPSGRSKNKP